MELVGKKGHGHSGELPGHFCFHTKMDIEALERLMELENEEVSQRYILKYSTRGGSNIFQLVDTAKKNNHFVANRKRWLESQGKRAAQQESGQHERRNMKYQRVVANAPPCPEGP